MARRERQADGPVVKYDPRVNLIPGNKTGGPIPEIPKQGIEQLKELFAKQLYAICMQPTNLQKFRDLLRSPEQKIRLEAWRLAFEHGWPVKEQGAARPTISIKNLIARPGDPKDVAATEVTVG